MAGDDRFSASAYEFAKLAITSLITTSSGALIALLAFAGQAKHFPNHGSFHLRFSMVCLGSALISAIGSSIAAYLNQYLLAFSDEDTRVWWIAFVAAILSLLFLIVGGWNGFWAVAWVVD